MTSIETKSAGINKTSRAKYLKEISKGVLVLKCADVQLTIKQAKSFESISIEMFASDPITPKDILLGKRVDVRIPNSNLYVVYNTYYQENEMKAAEINKYEGSAERRVLHMPWLDLTLYGKCVICKVIDGKLEDINGKDYEIIKKYMI